MNVELKANKQEIQRLTKTFKFNQLKIKKNFFKKKKWSSFLQIELKKCRLFNQ